VERVWTKALIVAAEPLGYYPRNGTKEEQRLFNRRWMANNNIQRAIVRALLLAREARKRRLAASAHFQASPANSAPAAASTHSPNPGPTPATIRPAVSAPTSTHIVSGDLLSGPSSPFGPDPDYPNDFADPCDNPNYIPGMHAGY
jgi:hypothetical protein